jgi:hypothetical protein
MAFEIIFHYYPYSDETNEYDKSKVSTYDKKLGDIFEEVSLEKLASVILTQLARRDVFVFDVEVCELVKKKILFKQNKNNILIKNKKFSLSNDTIVVQEINENLIECKKESSCGFITPIEDKVRIDQPSLKNNVSLKSLKILKTMTFMPSDAKYLKGKPWKFTPTKAYNIYREIIAKNGIGMILSTIDDTGREVEVTDEFFVNDRISYINEPVNNSSSNDDVLNWSGTKGFNMPDLRGN